MLDEVGTERKSPPAETRVVAGALLSIALAGCLVSCASQGQAKISKAEAEKIALARVPGGIIKEGEIEKEKGKLIWSFDVAAPGTADITEVQVDALNGEVLAVEKETPAEQEKEKRKDKD